MKKYLFTIVFLFFVNINFVFAFNNTIVHPGITNEAINLYLRSGHEGKLNKSEIESIINGAVNEDTDPRYLNHFYNPHTNKSLGPGLPTAKKWAFFQFSASGDFSVSTILQNYREGNKKRAYEGIGHILHLIQDMGVPAHVRLDPHPPWNADGFETATEKYAKYGYIGDLYKKEKINDIFDEFATYTVDNFYSNDRIDNLIRLDTSQGIKENDGIFHNYGIKNGHVICELESNRKGDICYLNDFIYKYYWQTIYPKTVTYSASAIDWFVDEFGKIDEENKKLSFWDKVVDKFESAPLALANSFNYVWGDTYLAIKDSVITGVNGAAYYTLNMGDALGRASDKMVKSSVEIAKEGTLGTLTSIGEASLLGGNAIEGLYKTADKTQGKVLSAYDEGAKNIKKVVDELKDLDKKEPKDSDISVLGLESEELIPEKKVDDSGSDSDDSGSDSGKSSWMPRQNILLFSGGHSSGVAHVEENESATSSEEEDNEVASSSEEEVSENIQDLSLISFEVFNLENDSREFTDSKSIGIEIETQSLENLDFYLSESTTTDDIIWSSVIPSSFEISAGDGLKNIYLHVRDENSQIYLESSISLASNFPFVEVISGPEHYSSSTKATFVFSANCVPTLFEYSFNGEPFQPKDLSTSVSDGEIFSEGENILNIRIKDEFGREATSSYSWIVDLTSPKVVFDDSDFNEDKITLNWHLASTTEEGSSIKYFELEKFIDSEFQKSFIIEANISSTTMTLENDLSFRIRAIDMAGNIGDWDTILPLNPEETVSSGHVLISEVGIDGTEFIELYNPTNNDVEIENWSLAYYSSKRDWYEPFRFMEIRPAEIESKGYFLISVVENELNIADDSFSYSADFINNSNGSIALFGAEEEDMEDAEDEEEEAFPTPIDTVAWGEVEYVFEGAPVQLSQNAISIERKANFKSSKESMLDINRDLFLGNGYDTNNNNKDFVTHSASNPQGNISSFEPRDLTLPGEVDDLEITSVGENEADIIWTAPVDSNIEIGALYKIFYLKNSDCSGDINWENSASTTIPSRHQKDYFIAAVMINTPYNHTIQGLNNDTEYCIAIKVFNGESWSDFSNTVNLRTEISTSELITPIPTVNDYISIDRLTKENSPYLIDRLVKVGQAGLIIEPGVVVKFSDTYIDDGEEYSTGILAEGPITAIGTDEEYITFTSDKDDEAGGDTNGDNNESRPHKGSWGSVDLNSKNNIFEKVVFEYGARDLSRGVLNIFEDENSILESSFSDNLKGVEISHASSTNPTKIINNLFQDTGEAISVLGDSNPILEGNIFGF